MRNLVFLDVDGVLNCTPFLKEAAKADNGKVVLLEQWDPLTHIDPKRVAKLNVILEKTGAEIVISSSWRRAFPPEKMQELLDAKGLVGKVIDQTPQLMDRERHVEIKRWLSRQADEPDFVVIDDDQDAGVGFGVRYIRTIDGLEDSHVDRAVAILGAR
jgi:hypothetical protein